MSNETAAALAILSILGIAGIAFFLWWLMPDPEPILPPEDEDDWDGDDPENFV